MSAIFDIQRFLNLEKRNLLTHKTQFLYASLIIVGYFIFSVLLYLLIGFGQLMVMMIYPLCFIVVACAPCFFEKSMNKASGIFDFMLPGSVFEKFLVMFLNYVIIVPILCFGILFLLVQLMGVLPVEALNQLSVELSFTNSIGWKSFYTLLVVQSAFMIGYFFFKKYSFIKTFLILAAAGIIFLILFIIIILTTFKDLNALNNMSAIAMMHPEIDVEAKIDSATQIPTILGAIFLPWGLWVASFLKLREKEI